MRIKTSKKIEERGSVRSGGNEKRLSLSSLLALETRAHSLFWPREKKKRDRSLCRQVSSFSLRVRRKEKEAGRDGLEDGGKTYLPQRNRFVNPSWPEPLHPVPVCALFTCLLKNLYFRKTTGFERQNDRTERNVIVLLRWLRAFNNNNTRALFYALSFSSSFPSPSNAMALSEIARLRSACGVNV